MAKSQKVKNRPHAIVFPDDGRTKQAFKKQCDIDQIMTSLNAGNVTGHVNTKEPKFGSVPASFQEVQNAIAAAKTTFEELPQEIQSRFSGYSDFVDALGDPERASDFETEDIEVETDGQSGTLQEAASGAPDTAEQPQQGATEVEESA